MLRHGMAYLQATESTRSVLCISANPIRQPVHTANTFAFLQTWSCMYPVIQGFGRLLSTLSSIPVHSSLIFIARSRAESHTGELGVVLCTHLAPIQLQYMGRGSQLDFDDTLDRITRPGVYLSKFLELEDTWQSLGAWTALSLPSAPSLRAVPKTVL